MDEDVAEVIVDHVKERKGANELVDELEGVSCYSIAPQDTLSHSTSATSTDIPSHLATKQSP